MQTDYRVATECIGHSVCIDTADLTVYTSPLEFLARIHVSYGIRYIRSDYQ